MRANRQSSGACSDWMSRQMWPTGRIDRVAPASAENQQRRAGLSFPRELALGHQRDHRAAHFSFRPPATARRAGAALSLRATSSRVVRRIPLEPPSLELAWEVAHPRTCLSSVQRAVVLRRRCCVPRASSSAQRTPARASWTVLRGAASAQTFSSPSSTSSDRVARCANAVLTGRPAALCSAFQARIR
jgi:hypothetical protein